MSSGISKTKNEEAFDVSALIRHHNRALSHLIKGEPLEGIIILNSVIKTQILAPKHSSSSDADSSSKINDGTSSPSKLNSSSYDPKKDVSCRICFVFLDCMVKLYRGDMSSTGSNNDYWSVMEDSIHWIESYLEELSAFDQLDSSSSYQHPFYNSIEEYLQELKFRLHIYKARLLFLQQEQNSEQDDSKTAARLLKKELKSALELYHHKLRRDDAATTSSVGSSSDVIASNPTTNTDTYLVHQPPTSSSQIKLPIPPSTQKIPNKSNIQNEIALYLKANHENWNNNTKRSLKLCTEAHLAAERYRDVCEGSPEIMQHFDQAIHFNNLAILHQTTGKIHVAFYYYNKSIQNIHRVIQSYSTSNDHDQSISLPPLGTTLPYAEILHNAAICAHQTKQHKQAYQLMSKCIISSPNIFAKRGRSWLRLAESCIAIHVEQCEMHAQKQEFHLVKGKKGVRPRIVWAPNQNPTSTANKIPNNDVALGSNEDIQNLITKPLHCALYCLHKCQNLCLSYKNKHDEDCLESARVSLAYIYLELNDPINALSHCRLVLLSSSSTIDNKEQNNIDADSNDETNHKKYDISRRLSSRRKVLARMYGCEALCIMGKSHDAFNFLFDYTDAATTTSKDSDKDEEKESTTTAVPSSYALCLAKYARELAMVPSNTSLQTRDNTNKEEESDSGTSGTTLHRKRLQDAVSVLHITASAIMSHIHEMELADKHAVLGYKGSTNNVLLGGEGGRSSEHLSCARKAVLYCMLRNGNTDGALAILRSMH